MPVVRFALKSVVAGTLTPAAHTAVKQLSQLNLALRADDGGDEGGCGGLPNWNTDSKHFKGMRQDSRRGMLGTKLNEGQPRRRRGSRMR